MGKVIFNMSVSLDGFVAGPNDDVSRVFAWMNGGDTEFVFPESPEYPLKVSRASAEFLREYLPTTGAIISGRRTFDLASAWNGKPPLGLPTVVVTHQPAQEWVKKDSPFTFVTDGVERAVEEAKKIAEDKNVMISGANVFQQCLRAGLVDEMVIDLAAVLLGEGVRLFENHVSGARDLRLTRMVEGIGVTHLCYSLSK